MMREIFDMPSSSLKLWMENTSTFIEIRGESEEFSDYEIEDLIDKLVELRTNRIKAKEKTKGSICPCGHLHEPSFDGNGLRTYCVMGSNCNSNKCKDFVFRGLSE